MKMFYNLEAWSRGYSKSHAALNCALNLFTIVGILTFISRINKASGSLKARTNIFLYHIQFCEQLNFMISLTEYDIYPVHKC